MRRLVPLAFALGSLTGCRSLSTTVSEPMAFGPDGVRQFERATVVVYTGRGDRTRRAMATSVVVRPDSVFWHERVTRIVTRIHHRAVPTRRIREVIYVEPAPQAARGAGRGLLTGLAIGGVALGAGAAAGCDGCLPIGLVVGGGVAVVAVVLGPLVGASDGAGATRAVHYRLNSEPPG